MNNNETLSKMSSMKLHGMKQSFELTLEANQSGKMTSDELIAMLIDAEYNDRQNRRLERLLKAARFRYRATVEEIDFSHKRNLNKNDFIRLASCDYVSKNESVIITGPTGAGKSYIASALGHQACICGNRVLYFNISKLFTRLKMLKADRSDIREKLKIEKHDLLILDDFGLQILDVDDRLALLEIIEDRHGNKSTIITSQLPVVKWHEAIGDETIADAILDRIVHTAHRIELNGSSLRKKKN
ncbi:IS21-like element helper ATPase IstB [Bacteroidota bacterium]